MNTVANILSDNQREAAFLVLVASQVLTLVVITVLVSRNHGLWAAVFDFLNVAKSYQKLAVSEAVQTKRLADTVAITAATAADTTAREAMKRVDEVAVRSLGVIQHAVTTQKLDGLIRATEAIQDQGNTIHTLVNSGFTAQLKISALALRRIAGLTGDVNDLSAAEVAEELLHDHERKQGLINQQDQAK